ncbi:DoxX protein [Candidatus Pacearchaeota archaeon]|nr:DoxX protein [Candidatus Pacearchaeota archaeon]
MNLRSRKVVRTVQIVFGLFLVFLVVSGYFQLLPPPTFNEAGMSFLGSLMNTGYLLHVMNIVFLLAGLMFIFNMWSPLGALLLAPITLNIALFHIFLDSTGWWMALIEVVLNIYLLVIHWHRYKPIFQK